jgi:hypothetical protein
MEAALRDLAEEVLAAQVATARASSRPRAIRSTRPSRSSGRGSAVSARGARSSARPRRGR